jgi:hypothetical protein
VPPRKAANLNHRISLLANAMVVVLSLSVAAAQTGAGAQPTQIPSGIQVQMAAPQKPVTIGDPVRLDLDISIPSGYQAYLPEIDKQIGDFTILKFSPEPQVADSNPPTGVRHLTASIVVAAYKTGTLTFPSLQIRVRTPEGREVTASSPPQTIQIQSVLSVKDQNLKNLKKQVEMKVPFPWRFWLIVLLVLGVLGILIWYLVKRRKKTAPSHARLPPRDPLEVAAEELKELLDGGLPEGGRVKHFYVCLSDIARAILEAAYGIPAVEQTTFEIMESLARSGSGTADHLYRVGVFLDRCDFVKFAKYIPSRPEHEATAKDALQILEDSRMVAARRRALPVAGAVAASPRTPTGDRPAEV